MTASHETLQTVRSLSQRATNTASSPISRAETAPPGLNEDTVRFISAKKGEPEWLLEWRLAGVPRLAGDDRAGLGQAATSRRSTIRRPPIIPRRSRRTGRNRSTRSIPSCWRPTRSSASRCASARRWPGVAVDAVFDSVSVATTFKEQLGRARHHLLLVRRGGARASRAGPQISRHRRAAERQFLRGAQFRRVQRRLLRLHPAGRALPDGALDLFPHQCARRPASSSARC